VPAAVQEEVDARTAKLTMGKLKDSSNGVTAARTGHKIVKEILCSYWDTEKTRAVYEVLGIPYSMEDFEPKELPPEEGEEPDISESGPKMESDWDAGVRMTQALEKVYGGNVRSTMCTDEADVAITKLEGDIAHLKKRMQELEERVLLEKKLRAKLEELGIKTEEDAYLAYGRKILTRYESELAIILVSEEGDKELAKAVAQVGMERILKGR